MLVVQVEFFISNEIGQRSLWMWMVFGFCTAAMTPIISLCLASLAEGPTVSSSTTQSERKLRSQVSITTLRTCQHLTIKCSNSRVVKHSIIQSCGLDMCKSPEWEECDTWVIMQLFDVLEFPIEAAEIKQ